MSRGSIPLLRHTCRRLYRCESLERRMLLSLSIQGIPSWTPQGPAPFVGANVVGMSNQNSPATGSIEALLTDPNNPDIVYAGSSTGGVWKTTNATAANNGSGSPSWLPLTDRQLSQSVSSLAFDPSDPSHNTIWAAHAHFSGLGADSSPLNGLLKTTNGGATWTVLGASTLIGIDVETVLPLAATSPSGQVVLVACPSPFPAAPYFGPGILRSVDGGNTFAAAPGIGFMGPGTDLAQDPTNSQRIYAAVAGQGVFQSDDAGMTWRNLNLPGASATGRSGRIILTVHFNPADGTFALYAAEVTPSSGGVQLTAVYRYTPTAGWQQIFNLPPVTDVSAGDPGAYWNDAIAADKSSQYVVYVSSNRVPGLNIGGAYRGDASTNTWTLLSGASAPHAGSRSMVVDHDGNLIQAGDGGVYRLINPGISSRQWVSLDGQAEAGNLSNAEVVSSAWDVLNSRSFGAAWDNGEGEQQGPSGLPWTTDSAGDGSGVAVDNNDPLATIRYFRQSGVLSAMHRREYNQLGEGSGDIPLQLASGAGQPRFSGLLPADDPLDSMGNHTGGGKGMVFTDRTVSGARRLLITGATGIYESSDKGDTISLDQTRSTSLGGVLSAVYGGRFAGADNPDVAYIECQGGILLRTTAGGPFNPITPYPNFGSLNGPRMIAVDPEDWHNIYALESGYRSTAPLHVWWSNNAGAPGSWVEITGNLNSYFTEFPAAGGIEIYHVGSTKVLLVSGQGGVFRLINPDSSTDWHEYGVMPNVYVSDIHYYPARSTANGMLGDLLLAGTVGRGTWSLSNVSQSISVSGALQISGDAGSADVITLRRDADTDALDLFVNSSVPVVVPVSAIQQIVVNGLGTSDVLNVDFSNGPFSTPITFNGGAGSESLKTTGTPGSDSITVLGNLLRQGGTTITYTNVQHLSINGGNGGNTINIGSTNAATTTSISAGNGDNSLTVGGIPNGPTSLGSIAGPLSVDGGSGFNSINVNDGGDTASATFSISGTSISRPLSPPLISFAAIGALTFNGGSGGDSLTISNTEPGMSVTINEGAGANSINLGAGFTRSITGVVTVRSNMLPSGNTLTVDDSLNGSSLDTATVSSSSIISNTGGSFFGFGGSLMYSGVSNVTLNAGKALVGSIGDTITVTPRFGMLFTINGGAPSGFLPGDSLIVSTTSGGVSIHPSITTPRSGYFTYFGSTTPIVQYTDIGSPSPVGWLAVGADAGSTPDVKVFYAQSGALAFDLLPFGSSFTGGIRVAAGDVNGDGIPDILTAQGPGGTGFVRVFDGVTGQQLAGPLGSFQPFGAQYTGGIYVAAGDVDGDGEADIIVGEDQGGEPRVRVFSGKDGSLVADFVPFDAAFKGGVRVAAADVNHNGAADVVAAAGPGSSPLVEVFEGKDLVQGITTPTLSFPAFDASFKGGLYVATGDMHGDGIPKIITGEGSGGEPRVSIFDGISGSQLQTFLAFDSSFQGGVRVAAADVNGDGRSDIVAAEGPGDQPLVRGFDGLSLMQDDHFLAFPSNFSGGVFVGGGGHWGIFNPRVPVNTIIGTPGAANTVTLRRDPDGVDDDVWLNVAATGDPTQLASLAQPIIIDGGGLTDALVLDSSNGNPLPVQLVLNGSFTTDALSIGANQTVSLAHTATPNTDLLAVNSLTIDPAGKLDLGDGSVRIAYSGSDPLAQIQGYLRNGYSNGVWTGNGITSSDAQANSKFAIGETDSADGIVSGQPANTILLKYVLTGDADENGKVDFADLVTLARDYNKSGADWAQGNFDYTGKVGFGDLVLLARNYNASAAAAPFATAALGPATTVADFKLDADPATVRSQAKDVKRREPHDQVLHRSLVPDLRKLFAGKMPAAAAFAMPSKFNMADMLRADLSTARAKWIEQAPTDCDRIERQKSDFLADVDHQGQWADF